MMGTIFPYRTDNSRGVMPGGRGRRPGGDQDTAAARPGLLAGGGLLAGEILACLRGVVGSAPAAFGTGGPAVGEDLVQLAEPYTRDAFQVAGGFRGLRQQRLAAPGEVQDFVAGVCSAEFAVADHRLGFQGEDGVEVDGQDRAGLHEDLAIPAAAGRAGAGSVTGRPYGPAPPTTRAWPGPAAAARQRRATAVPERSSTWRRSVRRRSWRTSCRGVGGRGRTTMESPAIRKGAIDKH